MKLTTKLNLIMVLIFSIGLGISGAYSYFLTQDNALQQVTDQAELIMEKAIAVRSYTVNEIRPLLNNDNDSIFHPQTVPAYAATQVSNLVQEIRLNYRYKEAVFNPTNPRDKATEFEETIIDQFIQNPGMETIVLDHIDNGEKFFSIAHPIKITNPACLECHSTPDRAPQAMRTIYGDVNGFGWQLNEVVGAQLVTVPYKLPAELAQRTLNSFLISLGLLFLLLFIVINIMIKNLVLKPVNAMTLLADDLSKGNSRTDALDVVGKDEIADLSRSFNRMRRSFFKLMQILQKERSESKDK